MSSNESEAQVNDAILDLVRNGRGHGRLDKKMAFRPRNDDLPPGYFSEAAEAEGISASAASEKASAAEKAPVVTKEAPVTDRAPESLRKPVDFVMDPLYFMRKRGLKSGPTDVSNPKSPIYNIRTIC